MDMYIFTMTGNNTFNAHVTLYLTCNWWCCSHCTMRSACSMIVVRSNRAYICSVGFEEKFSYRLYCKHSCIDDIQSWSLIVTHNRVVVYSSIGNLRFTPQHCNWFRTVSSYLYSKRLAWRFWPSTCNHCYQHTVCITKTSNTPWAWVVLMQNKQFPQSSADVVEMALHTCTS